MRVTALPSGVVEAAAFVQAAVPVAAAIAPGENGDAVPAKIVRHVSPGQVDNALLASFRVAPKRLGALRDRVQEEAGGVVQDGYGQNLGTVVGKAWMEVLH